MKIRKIIKLHTPITIFWLISTYCLRLSFSCVLYLFKIFFSVYVCARARSFRGIREIQTIWPIFSESHRISNIIGAFVCCFRVRVVQQRSPLAELLVGESEGGETRDSNFLEETDRIFSWQEKVFSPFEVDFYADEKNCLTDHQREYHRRIHDERLQGDRLYSYTENDSYYAYDDFLTKPYRHISISLIIFVYNRNIFIWEEQYKTDFEKLG